MISSPASSRLRIQTWSIDSWPDAAGGDGGVPEGGCGVMVVPVVAFPGTGPARASVRARDEHGVARPRPEGAHARPGIQCFAPGLVADRGGNAARKWAWTDRRRVSRPVSARVRFP